MQCVERICFLTITPVSKLQKRSAPSVETDTIVVPSGEQATELTSVLVWPVPNLCCSLQICPLAKRVDADMSDLRLGIGLFGMLLCC